MKTDELMIGDWVVYRGDAEYTNPVRIEGMDILTCELITEDREDVGFDGIEPIPLTAEILEKNGLKPDTAEDAYKYCYRIESVSIVECYANAGGRYRAIISFGDTRLRITLMFVHQLQHALRLCEIEKEIKI